MANTISSKIKQQLPRHVLEAARILRENNYEAYLVGGSVRDILLGKTPQDYDIATNAYPEVIGKIFVKSIPTGAQFGTMIVLLPDENGENHEIEITTYRSEADYFSGRWPAKVEFTKTIQEDLARRDFTINAIALRLDNDELSADDIVDPFGGLEDLDKRLIKAVGVPKERFSEDGLRSIRACRLAANLGFNIDPQTFAAIKDTLQVTAHVSMERVRDELMKLLLKSPKPSVGLELMRESGLLELFIPELLEGISVNQPQFHVDDVYTHTLKAVDIADDEVKLAALFHDIAKPRTRSEDERGVHFYGHDLLGGEMTEKIMKRLKFSNAEIERTKQLVRWHMFYYPNADWRRQNQIQGIDANSEAVTELFIVRHGETDDNTKDIVTGQNDTPLNVNGAEKAEQLALTLKSSRIDMIVTSPLSRAAQTAAIISKHTGAKVYSDDRLKDRHFGELQGLTWEDSASKYPFLAQHPDNNKTSQAYLPAGESISQVESRVKVALFNHVKNNLGKTVVIVTHQAVIRIIKRILGGMNIDESRSEDLDNLGMARYTVALSSIDPNFLTDEELEIVRQQQQENQSPNAGGWTDAAVRRFVRNVGSQELIDDLMKLRIADATANPKSVFNPYELNVLAERVAKVRAEDMAMKVTDLDIDGNVLMQAGFNGREIGKTLHHLLELVTDDPLLNKQEKLLELAQQYKATL